MYHKQKLEISLTAIPCCVPLTPQISMLMIPIAAAVLNLLLLCQIE